MRRGGKQTTLHLTTSLVPKKQKLERVSSLFIGVSLPHVITSHTTPPIITSHNYLVSKYGLGECVHQISGLYHFSFGQRALDRQKDTHIYE